MQTIGRSNTAGGRSGLFFNGLQIIEGWRHLPAMGRSDTTGMLRAFLVEFGKIDDLCSMEISFVVAASENNVIGKNNKLPWHLPNDLKFFKKMTMGKPVVMGRKTMESMGDPLPGRLNIVLSHSLHEPPEGRLLFASLDKALAYLQQEGATEVCIIGGGEVFRQALPLAHSIYCTRVHVVIEDGTAFFPEIDHSQWKLSWEESHAQDERHQFAYTFQKWERTAL